MKEWKPQRYEPIHNRWACWMDKDKEGGWVKYEAALKEIDKLKEMYEELNERHKELADRINRIF